MFRFLPRAKALGVNSADQLVSIEMNSIACCKLTITRLTHCLIINHKQRKVMRVFAIIVTFSQIKADSHSDRD